MSSFWTDARVEALRKHAADGLSAAQIAKLLGPECTRNMVIAKRQRMGLSQTREAALARRRASKPGSSRLIRAPELKTKPPLNPLGAKHRQSKPNQEPCIFGAGMRLNRERDRAQPPEPIISQTRKAELALLNQSSRRLTCIELRSDTCKWGTHEGGGDHRFCGQPVKDGKPYCEGHTRFAYQPTSETPAKRSKELARSLRRHFA